MEPVSLQTVMRSLEALAIEREVLVRRIGAVSSSMESDEQLAERVLWIDEAVNELMDAYEVARGGANTLPHISEFITLCDQQVEVLLGSAAR
jgi:hypothetical protein